MSETLINMTIDETCFIGQETGLLTGCLKAFLISVDKPAHILISLSENPNIRLLELNNFIGDKYVCIRVPCNDYKGDIYNYQVEEFALNDKLTIQAQGMPGTNIKLKIRVEE
jgi:hypothetical protein